MRGWVDGMKLSEWPRVGFSGTRKGMTMDQVVNFGRFMRMPEIKGEIHHGDCHGADSQAHDIGLALDWRVVVHPPTNPGMRAYKKGHELREPLPYIARNQTIVDATECLIAAPAKIIEEYGSGTWATIRYAKKQKKRTLVLWPDGGILLWTPERGPMGQGVDVL